MYNKPTKRFPKRLAKLLFPEIDQKNIVSAHLQIIGYLTIKLNDGSTKLKKLPSNLTPELMAKLERRIVVGNLILQGYSLKKLANGYKCITGTGEEYYMEEESCDCKDFSYGMNEREPCKHLLFKDGLAEIYEEIYSELNKSD